MEEKRQRLNEVIDWLIYKHIANSISDIAGKMGVNRSHLSSVLNDKNKQVTNTLLLKLCEAYEQVDYHWLSEGIGESVVNKNVSISGKNIVNGNAVASIVGDLNGVSVHIPNKYGDTPSEERKWAPVVPQSLARQPGFDIMSHLSKQMGGNLERLYSGTACIDIWHYVDTNDLYPHYQKGDCLGLKAYDKGDMRIKTGDIYVVDTIRDGMITRRFRINEDGDLVSYNYNDSDPQEFIIPKDDVIRVYKMVLMFRY